MREDRIAVFHSRVDRSGGEESCWPWKRYRDNKGYGYFYSGYTMVRTHRVAYELTYGPIPAGKHVLHRCDNPPCCNPAHLFLGSEMDNTHDAIGKGRRGSRLTWEKVREIRRRYAGGENSYRLAEEYGVYQATISKVVLGKAWVEKDFVPIVKGTVRGARHGMAKLTQEVADEIRRRYAAGGITQSALAKEYNSSPARICEVVNNKRWIAHVG